ncbi:MAG TPA: hypothetical protein VE781_09740 [Kineosporiaceae bacterium]|nr:hypothetical protein [Kineosporiaceae bacterium]
MTHATDPRLLMALWDADARGRVCSDPQDVADRVAYARLVLEELGSATPDSFGLLDVVDPSRSASPRARRETFRAHVAGEVVDAGAVGARLAASERHTTGASLTYTMGRPGAGKSTWARVAAPN